jgi:hypothetical protein
MFRTAALVCLIPFQALADLPMSAADFEAYATNKTITYDYGGGLLGVEQYLPGRQVRWSFEDDTCVYGSWYEDNGNICFVYDDGSGPQCWRFVRDGKQLRAQFMNDGGGQVITEIEKTSKPLSCSGPQVGV